LTPRLATRARHARRCASTHCRRARRQLKEFERGRGETPAARQDGP
jgi:hypothetical protein